MAAGIHGLSVKCRQVAPYLNSGFFLRISSAINIPDHGLYTDQGIHLRKNAIVPNRGRARKGERNCALLLVVQDILLTFEGNPCGSCDFLAALRDAGCYETRRGHRSVGALLLLEST